jgi:hypothetical protein
MRSFSHVQSNYLLHLGEVRSSAMPGRNSFNVLRHVRLVLMRQLFTLQYRFGIDAWHYTSNGLVHNGVYKHKVQLWKLLAISGLVVVEFPTHTCRGEPCDNSPNRYPVAVTVTDKRQRP